MFVLVHTGHDWAGDYDQRRPEELPQWHGPAVNTPADVNSGTSLRTTTIILISEVSLFQRENTENDCPD